MRTHKIPECGTLSYTTGLGSSTTTMSQETEIKNRWWQFSRLKETRETWQCRTLAAIFCWGKTATKGVFRKQIWVWMVSETTLLQKMLNLIGRININVAMREHILALGSTLWSIYGASFLMSATCFQMVSQREKEKAQLWQMLTPGEAR